MEAALGNRAANSLVLSKAYAYGGYSYIMLADYLCEAPVNLSAAYSQEELYGMAAERLQKALDIATAAGAQPGASDVINLAKVGLARVRLNLGENAAAIAAATGVPESFGAWVRYASDATDWQVYNFFHWFAGYRFPGELDLALDPDRYAAVNDPRMPIDRTMRRLGNGLRDGNLPYQPASFSDWAPATTVRFGENTGIRFASGLEARYIIAEAGGPADTASLRAFVNERRSAGSLGAFTGPASELRAELREQRFRDFFLDGHRMGDLRRYKKLHGVDLWPTGTMPGLTTQYGTQECWPIAQSEIQSNPNLRP
jgi:hypothetical protein